MIDIDGSYGEGGGQIVRSAVSLSAVTGQPCRITRLRANRSRPGLLRQHAAAIGLCAEICQADVEGAALGAVSFTFRPGAIDGGDYYADVASAGSANLVLQTALPLLLRAPRPSTLTLRGGTHNPASPAFDFIERAFLPVLNRMGGEVHAEMTSAGFFPAGGGELRVRVTPISTAYPLELVERGPERDRQVVALLSNLPGRIGLREVDKAGDALNVDAANRHVRSVTSPGPGNALVAEFQFAAHTAVFVEFGMKNVTAKSVVKRLVGRIRPYLTTSAAVSTHLADQLLLPLALGSGGTFSTLKPSQHSLTNAQVIERFTGKTIRFDACGDIHLCHVPGH